MAEALFSGVPEHWEWTTLGDVCARGGGDIQTGPFGSQLHAADYVPVGVPSIMPQNIGDNRIIVEGIARITRDDAVRLSRYLVRAGDIVYSRRGDVERRALIREAEDGWLCGTGCLRVRLGQGVADPLFASYYLGHPEAREWIVRHAIGATMPNLNTSILSALPFLLPPLSEQRAIGQILGALDDKIELNRRVNETLEAMARAIFKSWFVDFDPVYAKAEGRQPAGMDVETAELFPQSFAKASGGEVPEGWQIASLADVVEIVGGGTPRTSVAEYWDGDVPWFSVVDAPGASDVYVIDTQRTISSLGLENSATRVLPVNTTIISARGTVGKLALVGSPMAMNQSCYALRGKEGIGPYFVYFAAKHLVTALQQNTHGTVFDTITRDTFAAIDLVIPSQSALSSFERQVEPLLRRILSNLHESRTLAAIRDALLPKLLSGEVRIGVA